jgi:hypothetical protein
MPGHSRSKNGVASLAYVPGIHALLCCETKDVDGRDKPGHDGDEHLRIFTVVSSIFGRVEGTTAAFHIKLFHAKGIGFQGLRKLHEQIRRSCLTFISVPTNCATVSLNKGAF